MVGVDPLWIGSLVALLLGSFMVAGGLYARRNGRLRYREGAAILAGFAAVLGVLVFGFGIFALVRA